MKNGVQIWSAAALWAASIIAVGMRMAPAAEGPSTDEQEIRALQSRLAADVSAGDLDGVMKAYVPGNKLFVFDSDLPRQHTGWESFKQDWGNFVNSAKGVKYDVQELGVTVVGNAAFSHHLAHLVWTNRKDGSHHEQLMSLTDAYRKIDGKWLIVMEHFSLPVVNGKAVFVAWPKD
jgi:ketosteroid isomerase-like protein